MLQELQVIMLLFYKYRPTLCFIGLFASVQPPWSGQAYRRRREKGGKHCPTDQRSICSFGQTDNTLTSLRAKEYKSLHACVTGHTSSLHSLLTSHSSASAASSFEQNTRTRKRFKPLEVLLLSFIRNRNKHNKK